jgi:hypothetical protein
LEAGQARVLAAVTADTTLSHRRDNMPPAQRAALVDLVRDPRLVIANADKGLGPVVLEEIEYSRLTMTLLDGASVYTSLEDDDFSDLAGLHGRIKTWAIQLG